MKTRTTALVGATGLTVSALLGLLPATIAAATPLATAPLLTNVDGWKVDYDWYGGSTASDPLHEVGNVAVQNRTPTMLFTTSPSQSGGLLSARAENGDLLCSARVPKTGTTECTPKEPLPFGVSRVTGSILSAHGTVTSDKGLRVDLLIRVPDPTIRIDSYDDAAHLVSLSGRAEPGSDLIIHGTDDEHREVTPENGRWHTRVKLDRGDYASVSSTVHHTRSSAHVQLDLPSDVPTPTVNAEKKNGYFLLTVHHLPGTTALLRDLNGKIVMGGSSGQVSDGEMVTQLRVDDTGREARYSVVADRSDKQSVSVPVVLNSGAGSDTPEKPSASVTGRDTTHAIIAVTGEKKAVIKISDESGGVIAVRSIGESGSAQVPVRLPAGRADTPVIFEVAQTAGGATSPATRLVLSSTPAGT